MPEATHCKFVDRALQVCGPPLVESGKQRIFWETHSCCKARPSADKYFRRRGQATTVIGKAVHVARPDTQPASAKMIASISIAPCSEAPRTGDLTSRVAVQATKSSSSEHRARTGDLSREYVSRTNPITRTTSNNLGSVEVPNSICLVCADYFTQTVRGQAVSSCMPEATLCNFVDRTPLVDVVGYPDFALALR